jgi:hypothetical protein
MTHNRCTTVPQGHVWLVSADLVRQVTSAIMVGSRATLKLRKGQSNFPIADIPDRIKKR